MGHGFPGKVMGAGGGEGVETGTGMQNEKKIDFLNK